MRQFVIRQGGFVWTGDMFSSDASDAKIYQDKVEIPLECKDLSKKSLKDLSDILECVEIEGIITTTLLLRWEMQAEKQVSIIRLKDEPTEDCAERVVEEQNNRERNTSDNIPLPADAAYVKDTLEIVWANI